MRYTFDLTFEQNEYVRPPAGVEELFRILDHLTIAQSGATRPVPMAAETWMRRNQILLGDHHKI